MAGPIRILFYSGSIGLGHVTRDVAIADSVRDLVPEAQIDWLASSPAYDYLAENGERLHEWAAQLDDSTTGAEARARDGKFNITRWAVDVRKRWGADGRLVLAAASEGRYDALIGDEAYDVAMALTGGASHPRCPCFVLYDFLGLDRMGMHPVEWIGAEAINRAWARDPHGHYEAVFLGDREDIPHRRFGLLGPSRRDWVDRNASVVGHVLAFAPDSLPDRATLRSLLGYGPEPLVVTSVGGTSVGDVIIERCLQALPLVRREIPDLHMVLVGGPRSAVRAPGSHEGVEIRTFVPRLYEHFAASDLAIVQGGGATTLELTVLGRPFLFFPLLGHCEQLRHVAARQRRLGAGVQLDLRRTSPEELCRWILATIGRETQRPQIKTDGAREVARLLVDACATRPPSSHVRRSRRCGRSVSP